MQLNDLQRRPCDQCQIHDGQFTHLDVMWKSPEIDSRTGDQAAGRELFDQPYGKWGEEDAREQIGHGDFPDLQQHEGRRKQDQATNDVHQLNR